MSLLTEQMKLCVYYNKALVSDSYGGYSTVYTEGVKFRAAVVIDSSIEARVAEVQGAEGIYTVTTGQEITLQYHDVFKRLEDGKIFRVTSDGDDNKTPKSASLNMRNVNAEEWSLPNG